MGTRAFCNLPSSSHFDAGGVCFSRRHFIPQILGGLALLTNPARQWAQAETSGFDFSLLDDWITPNVLFFVRHHSSPPTTASENWTISVSGAVAAPYELRYADLIQQPSKTLAATIECAENPVGGGLVSNAAWTGASLSALLERAKPLSGARFVRLHGADDYVKTIPLPKAVHTDTLIAYRMNGDTLSAAHGNPARAVIPGWYGMDSVKWLREVELTEEDHDQTYLRRGDGPDRPVTRMHIKAAFARPLDGAIIRGHRFIVRGAAWAGEDKVGKVELSVDGGRSWQMARLQDVAQPYAWVRWEWQWQIAASGVYELLVRAADAQGRLQPAERSSSRLDPYEQDTYQKVRVAVVWGK